MTYEYQGASKACSTSYDWLLPRQLSNVTDQNIPVFKSRTFI